ncbi:Pyruvate/Phosphoenolpyruvate kinase-like domain-containing protein [Pestalotiopsis sp. NC0098]|nr:Pyruvate/Phosphoenolpyruvate kinase-like domain-containing protein [Pestalotiopsis sp. NC0098]
MVETRECIANIDAIASTKGVDVLLVGSNDLSVELGVPGDYKSQEFQLALETISEACKKHGKILGFAGIYENHELQEWAIKKLGAGFILGQQDSGLLARSAVEVVNALADIEGQTTD